MRKRHFVSGLDFFAFEFVHYAHLAHDIFEPLDSRVIFEVCPDGKSFDLFAADYKAIFSF